MPAEDRYAEPLALEPGRIIRDTGEPIQAGSMLWVFTDPDRGQEFAYNRWYERDHYYGGCMIGPYHFAGSRWVAPRRYRDVRFPQPGPMPFPVDAGTYACLYWYLGGHHEDAIDWATPQVHALYAEDRGFGPRTHHNTGTFGHAWRAHPRPGPGAPGTGPRPPLSGNGRPVRRPGRGGHRGAARRLVRRLLPTWLAGSPIATVAHWTTIPLRDDKPDFTPVDPDGAIRSLQVHFVEADPLEVWDAEHQLAEDLAASGLGSIAFAAPFLATVIGTDRYVDELW